jgi:hypothetical protein
MNPEAPWRFENRYLAAVGSKRPAVTRDKMAKAGGVSAFLFDSACEVVVPAKFLWTHARITSEAGRR